MSGGLTVVAVVGDAATNAVLSLFRADRPAREVPGHSCPMSKLYFAGRSTRVLSTGPHFGAEVLVMAVQGLLLAEPAVGHIALVVHVGYCGSVDAERAPVGSLVLAQPSVFNFDRRVAAFGELSKTAGLAHQATWEQTAAVARAMRSQGTEVCEGRIGSGRSFDTDDTGLQWLRDQGAVAKDMESSSVVWTCTQFSKPCACLKMVSNLVGPGDADDHKLNSTGDHAGLVAGLRSFLGCLEAAPAHVDPLHYEVGIVVAMRQEAAPLARALGCSVVELPQFVRFGCPTFDGEFAGRKVLVISHGVDVAYGLDRVGPEVAVFITSLLCQHAPHLRLILNAGTAGAMAGHHEIGAVTIASRVRFIDRRFNDLQRLKIQPQTHNLAVWAGRDPLVRRLTEAAAERGLPNPPGTPLYPPVTVGTGSSFDLSAADLTEIKALGATVKEMEAAGVALVANQHRVPFLCVKAITDVVGANTGHEDFHRNLTASMDALATQLPDILSCAVEIATDGVTQP